MGKKQNIIKYQDSTVITYRSDTTTDPFWKEQERKYYTKKGIAPDWTVMGLNSITGFRTYRHQKKRVKQINSI
jgi:hypothetical protein